MHVARVKNGTPATHPIGGPELRALRELKRQYPESPYLFVTERGGSHDAGDDAKDERMGRGACRPALPDPSPYAAALSGLPAGERRPRRPRDLEIPRAQKHHVHGALYGAES